MAWLYAVTLGLSAFLLFVVQPVFAKMLLPHVGGAPGVWNTCVVFFQIALLAGYAYAHAWTRLRGRARQAGIHLVFLLAPLAILPFGIDSSWRPATTANPIWSLFALLVTTVGLPFVVVSTTAPLLQRWFSYSSHRAASDPYFLYAASNAGSMGALIANPLLIEPTHRLRTQALAWSAGNILLVVLTMACAWVAFRRPAQSASTGEPPATVEHPETIGIRRRLRWLGLSAAPSSLMLSVTTAISVDIAAVPLLWVAPLALYLLSFIVVFSRRPIVSADRVATFFPLAMLVPVGAIAVGSTAIGMAPVHLIGLFTVALYCHGELAADRPAPVHLTEFYLWLSLGGAIGGLFNAIAAPLLFTSTIEYPLSLVVACLLRRRVDESAPRRIAERWQRLLDVALPLAVAGLVVALRASAARLELPRNSPGGMAHILALPLAVALASWRRPIRFALAIAAVMAASIVVTQRERGEMYAIRTFYGIHRVIDSGGIRLLLHGTTNHGAQATGASARCDPLTYYHRTGPAGHLFASFVGQYAKTRIAVVGLGSGTLSVYHQPGQQWTFYEINSEVERIATNPRLFTYLTACGADYRIVLGDARFSLADAADGAYDVILFDAFSSDAVPVHLVTREALELYVKKLAPGGILAFHISNRYLDLEPVLESLAADLGLARRIQRDMNVTPAEEDRGKLPSKWAIMARDEKDFGYLADDVRWQPLAPGGPSTLWTDDYSNIVSTLKWRR